MKYLLPLLLLLPSCMSLMPDGSRAVSLEDLGAALEAAAGDVRAADLNGDGMIQIDSDSGVSIAALEGLVRTADLGLAARDMNGDGMLDSRELLGAAPLLVARLVVVGRSASPAPANGDAVVELGLLAASIVDRVTLAMGPVQ